MQQLKKSGDKPNQDIQIVNLPEMTFIGLEYKKILSFEEVYQLVIAFKEKIKSESFRNADDIYVIKGIGSLPQYNVPDADPFKFKFSLIVGIPVSNTDSIPVDMKVYTIPPHTYDKFRQFLVDAFSAADNVMKQGEAEKAHKDTVQRPGRLC
jgi:predicted transcriptional regulator YdeE